MTAMETSSAPKQQTRSPEFVAVVMAATTGARLFPLTSKQTPKHLLPVGGVPLLTRLLEVIASSGFESCVVAIAKDDTATVGALRSQGMEPVSTHPRTVLRAKNGMQVTLVHVSEDCAGSAQALVQLNGAAVLPPTSHVVVMPADLVILDPLTLTSLADVHRQGNFQLGSSKKQPSHHAACTILLADVGEKDEHGVPLKESAKQKKGGLAREEEDIEYVGLSYENSSSTPRVVWKQSKIDVEQDDDFVGKAPQLKLPKPRLRCGVTKIGTDWSDLHVYALSPWVRQWLSTRGSALSLQSDVLPLLVSRQFRGVVATFGSEAMTEHKETLDQVLSKPPFAARRSFMDKVGSPEQEEQGMGAPSGIANAIATQKHEYAVAAHVLQPSTPKSDSKFVALRASSIPAYLYACREVVSRAVDPAATKNPCLTLPEGSTVQSKFQSILLADATTGDKVTCKSSTIGRRSKLGSKCRLSRVVVMDDVTVGDNCVLQISILGAGCSIGENCSLNDCQVGTGKVISSGTKAKGESFFEETLDNL